MSDIKPSMKPLEKWRDDKDLMYTAIHKDDLPEGWVDRDTIAARYGVTWRGSMDRRFKTFGLHRSGVLVFGTGGVYKWYYPPEVFQVLDKLEAEGWPPNPQRRLERGLLKPLRTSFAHMLCGPHCYAWDECELSPARRINLLLIILLAIRKRG